MSYRSPPLTVTRGETFHSSLMNTPNDVCLRLRDVEPNDRPALSKRPRRRATSESTSSNVPPLMLITLRARLRRLWFLPRSQLPPILIVCWPRVCVSAVDTLHD